MQRSRLKKSLIAIAIVCALIIISYLTFLTVRFLIAEHYHFSIRGRAFFAVEADANLIQKIIDGEITNQTQWYTLPFDRLNRVEVEKLIEYMNANDLKIVDTAGHKTSQIYLSEYASCKDMIKFFKFASCREL